MVRSHALPGTCIGLTMPTALRTISGRARDFRHMGVDALREKAGNKHEGRHVEGIDHIKEICDTTGRTLYREQHVTDDHEGHQNAFCVVELQISFLHKTPH